MRTISLAAAALLLLPTVLTGQGSLDRLTPDLYWEFESVSDPQISPENRGKTLGFPTGQTSRPTKNQKSKIENRKYH